MKNLLFKILFPGRARELERILRDEEIARTRLELCRGRLGTLEARRNVSWPKPAKRISAAQVLAEFNVPLDQGLPAALHQELDDSIQELLDMVSQPPSAALTGDMRLHFAGGIEHMRLFQKNLLDLSARASKADADLQEENDEKPK